MAMDAMSAMPKTFGNVSLVPRDITLMKQLSTVYLARQAASNVILQDYVLSAVMVHTLI